MAATSPYQQNDYQAVSNYRPYQLPVNDIFKAVSAQNEFWDEGARRVKSAYDDALNLKLTLEPNKEIRKKFMEDAEKQITKLSSMDLRDPAVQRQGTNIFKPLFQDEGIMYDDMMTRHYEKVRNDALSYREKDNGKGFSATNLMYAMDGYSEFANSKDRMAGKKVYSSRKEYEPFYDPTSELGTILKNCKPSTASNDSPQGYYINTYSNESLTSAKINSCMDAGLSDKAKRQLQINGFVTYKNNPEALRDNYVPHLSGTLSQLQEENAAIQGVLANKNNLKSLGKTELEKLGLQDASQITPDFIKSLEQKKQNNDGRIINLNTTINKLNSGDFSDIMGENFETVAGTVYSRDYMQNIGEGFSYDFSKNTKKADPAQMMFYQQHEINARQEDEQAHDLIVKQAEFDNAMKLKQMEMLYKSGNLKQLIGGVGGTNSIDDARIQNDTNSPFSTVDTPDSYDKVTQNIQDIVQKRTELNQKLLKDMKQQGLDPAVTSVDDARFNNFWSNFTTTASSDPEKQKVVDNYLTNMGKLVALQDLYTGTQASVDKKVDEVQKTMNIKTDNLRPITLEANGEKITITPQDIIDNISGKAHGINVDAMSYSPGTFYVRGFTVNGKNYYGDDNYNKFAQLYQNLAGQMYTKETTLKQKRNELMQDETIIQRPGYNFTQLNENEGEFKKRIAQEIGVKDKFIGDIIIGQTDLDGRVVVTLQPSDESKKAYDTKLALEKLKRYGGRDNKVTKDSDNQVVLEGINELDLINNNDLGSVMTPYVRNLEKRVTNTKDASTPYMRSMSNGTSYRISISTGYGGGYEYKIYDQKDPSSPVFSSQDREQALGTFNQLTQTKSQIKVPK